MNEPLPGQGQSRAEVGRRARSGMGMRRQQVEPIRTRPAHDPNANRSQFGALPAATPATCSSSARRMDAAEQSECLSLLALTRPAPWRPLHSVRFN